MAKSKSQGPPPLSSDASRLRAAWIAAVRAWEEVHTGRPSQYMPSKALDGGVDPRSGRRHGTGLWDSVAVTLAKAGLEPARAAGCLLSWWPGGGMRPHPRDTYCAENIRRYQDRERRRPLEIEQALRTDLITLWIEITRWSARFPLADDARRVALADTSTDLSDLFRYAMAVAYGYEDVALTFFPTALDRYRADFLLYDRLWATLLHGRTLQCLKGGRHA